MRHFILVLVGAAIVAVLSACGGEGDESSSTTTDTTPPSTTSTSNAQGDFVALLSDGRGRVAFSTDGQQLIAYACDGDESHSPTVALWFQGYVTDNTVDLSTPGGDLLLATLTPQNATGTIALKDGTSIDFTAIPLVSTDTDAGSGLYRSQATFDSLSYLAGWIVDKPLPGGVPKQGGAILNQQSQELLRAPQLEDTDISSKQVSDPKLGTFSLTKCQFGTCS